MTITMTLVVTAGTAGDDELGRLLREVYVDGGFTAPELADRILAPSAVRARGTLITARDSLGTLVGTIIVVPPDSPAHQFGTEHEAELHLLAVRAPRRQEGVGQRLVEHALSEVRERRLERVVLWTQPTMRAAQRLYERCGFTRIPERDFVREDRAFQVYGRPASLSVS